MINENGFKFRETFATESYLKIEKYSYLDFIKAIPFSQKNEDIISPPINGEYKRDYRNDEFKYKNESYEIFLTSGMPSISVDNEYKLFPLPSHSDETIKNIILRSLKDLRHASEEEVFIIRHDEAQDFISSIIVNAHIDGYSFNKEEVIGALIKIQSCFFNIRCKGLNDFHPLSWPIIYQHNDITNETYLKLSSLPVPTK